MLICKGCQTSLYQPTNPWFRCTKPPPGGARSAAPQKVGCSTLLGCIPDRRGGSCVGSSVRALEAVQGSRRFVSSECAPIVGIYRYWESRTNPSNRSHPDGKHDVDGLRCLQPTVDGVAQRAICLLRIQQKANSAVAVDPRTGASPGNWVSPQCVSAARLLPPGNPDLAGSNLTISGHHVISSGEPDGAEFSRSRSRSAQPDRLAPIPIGHPPAPRQPSARRQLHHRGVAATPSKSASPARPRENRRPSLALSKTRVSFQQQTPVGGTSPRSCRPISNPPPSPSTEQRHASAPQRAVARRHDHRDPRTVPADRGC